MHHMIASDAALIHSVKLPEVDALPASSGDSGTLLKGATNMASRDLQHVPVLGRLIPQPISRRVEGKPAEQASGPQQQPLPS